MRIAWAIAALVAVIVIAHEIARHAATLILDLFHTLPKKAAAAPAWTRSDKFRSSLAARSPKLFGFLRDRIDPRRVSGLLFTLMTLAALYIAALFGGLSEDILEEKQPIFIDSVVNAAFVSWRVEPFLSAGSWITALGSSPSIISAVLIATGFLWSQRRFHIMLALWVTCFGALATTSIGKFLIGRPRPVIAIDVTVATSSFPSGHATAAVAVYGFLAYAIARGLPSVRQRFEVVYGTVVLILLIGFSRIFLGVHYFTDVIGGFLVGGFWLLIGFAVAELTGADPCFRHDGGAASIHEVISPRDDGP